MKLLKLSFLLLLAIFILPQVTQASLLETQIFYNGKQMQLGSNTQVEMIHNQVMVPIRIVVQEMGYKVTWDKKNNQIHIKEGKNSIDFTVNQDTALVNGSEVKLANAVILKKGTSLIPLRFLGEHMGLEVKWDQQNRAVTLTEKAEIPASIPKDIAEADTAIPEFESDPRYLEGTNLISAISYSDNRLLISASSNLVPQIFTLSNPERIVIDLPNTAFSNSFGTTQQLDQNNSGQIDASNDGSISNIRYALFKKNPSTVRIVLDTNSKLSYKADTSSPNTLLVNISSTAAALPAPSVGHSGKKVIVIDAGHGGQDPGTLGASNTLEKNFNLSVALKVEALLKQESEINVIMTRSDDTYITRPGRSKVANDLQADAFISIHANAAGASASGTETYYYKSSSKEFASVMHEHLIEATGFKDRGLKTAGYIVLKDAAMPATLLEVGFLSNAKEEAILVQDSFQNKVAEAIVEGIKDYFEIS